MEKTPDPVTKEAEEASPEEKKVEERKKAKLEEINKIKEQFKKGNCLESICKCSYQIYDEGSGNGSEKKYTRIVSLT